MTTSARPLAYTTKTEALTHAILDMAATLPPHSRLPAMGAMAQRFNVSKVTLDIALKDAEQRGAIVRKNGVGIFVSPTARQKTVGVVFGFDLFGPNVSAYYRLLLQLAREHAPRHQMALRFYLDLLSPQQGVCTHTDLMEDISNRRVNGLIGVGILDDNIEELERLDIPMVHLASGHPSRGQYKVGGDFRQMVTEGVAALAAAGARRIGLLTPSGLVVNDHKGSLPVPEAFRAALKAQRIEEEPLLCFEYPAAPKTPAFDQINWSRKTILDFYRQPKNRKRHPDALLVLDDHLTYGALLAFDELNRKAGEEILIASQAVQEIPLFDQEKIIRLETNPTAIIEATLEMLQSLMLNEQPPSPQRLIPLSVYAASCETCAESV